MTEVTEEHKAALQTRLDKINAEVWHLKNVARVCQRGDYPGLRSELETRLRKVYAELKVFAEEAGVPFSEQA